MATIIIDYLASKKFKSKEEYLKDLEKRKAKKLAKDMEEFNKTNY